MKNVKIRLYASLLLVALPIAAMAGRFATRYENGAQLAQKGNDIVIANWNLEWPVLLDQDSLTSLADTLSSVAFGRTSHSLAEALRGLTPNGATVLDKMPDGDHNTTYINAEVKVLWYEQGKYITLSATGQRRLKDGTVEFSRRKIFTYDLTTGRVLTKDDMFKPSCIKHNENSQMFYELIANSSNVSTNTLITWDKTVSSPAIIGDNVFFDLTDATEINEPIQYATLPTSTLANLFFSKTFKKWLAVNAQSYIVNAPKSQSQNNFDDLWPGRGLIETNTDASVPIYEGGYKKLMADIGGLLKTGDLSAFNSSSNKTVVSFVVEKDGSISNVVVLRPMNASADREIVKALTSTTGWKTNGTTATRIQITLPFNFILR